MVNANDEIFEKTLDQQLNSFRIEGDIRTKVLKDLLKMEKKIIKKIELIAPEQAENFTTRRLNRMLREVRKIIRTDYKDIDKKLGEELAELARIESKRQGVILADSLDVELDTDFLPISKINSIYKNSLIEGAPSSEWWSRQSSQLQRKFQDEMRVGILSGDTNAQLVRRVRGSKSFNFKNGIMQVSRRNAEALVRSSVQTSSNQARFEMMEANVNLIGSYRHVSTLDSRTSSVCIVRDGKRWKADTKEPLGHSLPFLIPPIHWNCRSSSVAEVKGTRLPKDATRASDSGEVPANDNFEDFLSKKGKGYQDETLGKGKAELWRNGKITLNQLLDQQGNPLTLSQLEAKYNQ